MLCLEMGVGLFLGRVLGAALGEDAGCCVWGVLGAVLERVVELCRGVGLCLGEWGYAGGYA